jgi:hypothetical protein
MIKRNTLILLALFVALAGFAVYQKYFPSRPAPDKNATPFPTMAPVEFLFPAEAGEVTRVSLENSAGESVRLERRNNVWVLTQPFDAGADQTLVEEAVTQVTALTVLSRLELDAAVVGLKSPAYTVTIGFSSGTVFVTEIGDATPTDTGYYARKEDGSIIVIDKYGMDALLNLLLYPPYLETPTPSPVPPTETPSPTPLAASETPTVTKTP